ncbi:[protein-PII] uridylyltransferase [Nocardioides sp. ChNu-153]|uniref:[protein-PII] uridylyltransferase n=1 Tax=unclassified Nocardioides TaxID=2615069 RepID=UPI002406EE5A|nr:MULTISPECIES: [protein-PII] uridylyltransferase [unclassified Nocardioides]MDF9716901.1 [protein-PII] uridylyltransferase [Nocardioides sp. ChNu-99]MDN7122631.1 [protein-PII] uridylyltransferase [Nocardioides sp. ChNu-153]
MTARERARRTAEADALCARAYAASGGTDTGTALVAVGGYGRGDLAPYSDLDVVLLHDDDVDAGELAGRVWYPLWDAGAKIDHSVRSVSGTTEAAAADLKVALGLLDVRHLAGDPGLTLRLRSLLLAAWRRGARERLVDLRALVCARHEMVGELAHASVPDVKEAEGGLRDTTVLKALVATWLVDIPHTDLAHARRSLLDVRDHVHDIAGRATDRIAPEAWDGLAQRLDLPDAVAAQVHVRDVGRRIDHISRTTWRRVDAVLAQERVPTRPRTPGLQRIAPGVALAAGEVVLDRGARPAQDPVLVLRAAAEAAERDVLLAPATAARLARESAPLPEPWPAEARQLLVRLLASGPGLLDTWSTLEETGVVARLLPEWSRIRSLPHASVVHRFTVDRHVVETCIEASALIRTVARPDVLMVAALLHDIGKGGLTEHSVAGESIARAVAERVGFAPDEVDLVGDLVRWHLLLSETATTRDPDDPATVALVAEHVRTPEALSLLGALTEADCRATSPKAWSTWRAGLVRQLSRRTLAALLAGATGAAAPRGPDQEWAVPVEVRSDGRAVAVEVERTGDGARITAVAADRNGVLADVAAALAVQRVPVRAARAWSQDRFAVSVWETADEVDVAVLRQQVAAIAEGRLDPRERIARQVTSRREPSVVVRPEASTTATVIEVRMDDRPGVVALVCRTLADLDVSVRSAHISTLGPQAVDVFYVQEDAAGALSDERAAEAAHALRDVLAATVRRA